MTYDNNNIFAKILRNEIPCKKIYEDEFVLSFHDINPQKNICWIRSISSANTTKTSPPMFEVQTKVLNVGSETPVVPGLR